MENLTGVEILVKNMSGRRQAGAKNHGLGEELECPVVLQSPERGWDLPRVTKSLELWGSPGHLPLSLYRQSSGTEPSSLQAQPGAESFMKYYKSPPNHSCPQPTGLASLPPPPHRALSLN